ncbi:MAG: carbohydrate kinase family protein [Promethearchaeota archaeon]
MTKKPEIIGLGEIAVDWVFQVPHFPEPDEKVDALTQNHFVGGVTTNFLTTASKLGASTGFIGALGDDDYGKFLLNGLKKVNIDTTLTLKKGPTAVNFIIVARDSGEKMIIQSPYFQTTRLEVSDLDESYFNDAKVLHTTALHTDLTIECIKIAKKKNITVSLDLEKQIAIRGKEILKPIIEGVDILLPNKEGAKTLTGELEIKKAAKKLLKWGPRAVIITLGGDGCLITTDDMQETLPAYKVKVVDTTGAGDAFCASFVVAHILKGYSLHKAGLFANAVAAIKIQHLGATSGLPTWDEAVNFQNLNLAR